jgi:glycosyltransferase involved in cell wall biosynthesis
MLRQASRDEQRDLPRLRGRLWRRMGIPPITATDLSGRLCLPSEDTAAPEVTILVPTLNEELTIGEFVEWCKIGARRVGTATEILVVDSSTDRTAEIARAQGARVLTMHERGLGRAYIGAIPHVRGRYVIMGDGDCTYDFRDLQPFVEQLRAGFDFVMGSRFKGRIERGAMPLHHRYFGMPVTTWILNRLCSSRYSDIHCGMRGISRDALVRMRLQSKGWQYASEMIIKAEQLELRVTEVPIDFYRDRDGRISNVKRSGWQTAWKAGWESLRVMFVFRADYFLLGPGIAAAVFGLLTTTVLSVGPLNVGPLSLTLHTEALTGAVLIIGLACAYMGLIATLANDLTGAQTRRLRTLFDYSRTVWLSVVGFLLGLLLDARFAGVYIDRGFRVLPGDIQASHLAIAGLLLIIAAFLTFAFTLVFHAVGNRIEALLPIETRE